MGLIDGKTIQSEKVLYYPLQILGTTYFHLEHYDLPFLFSVTRDSKF